MLWASTGFVQANGDEARIPGRDVPNEAECAASTGAPTVGIGDPMFTTFSSAVRARGTPHAASVAVSIRTAGRAASRSYFGAGSDGFP